jgi:hypothetical protein
MKNKKTKGKAQRGPAFGFMKAENMNELKREKG